MRIPIAFAVALAAIVLVGQIVAAQPPQKNVPLLEKKVLSLAAARWRPRPSPITGAALSRSLTTAAGSLWSSVLDHAAMTAPVELAMDKARSGAALQETKPGAGGCDQSWSLRSYNRTRLCRIAGSVPGGIDGEVVRDRRQLGYA
jgi:hypothetical protein